MACEGSLFTCAVLISLLMMLFTAVTESENEPSIHPVIINDLPNNTVPTLASFYTSELMGTTVIMPEISEDEVINQRSSKKDRKRTRNKNKGRKNTDKRRRKMDRQRKVDKNNDESKKITTIEEIVTTTANSPYESTSALEQEVTSQKQDVTSEKEDVMTENLDEGAIPAEQRLMLSLLETYERSVRPVKNASDTVAFKMGLTLTQIFDMDEKNQVLITNVWLDQEWEDMFLTWDPEEYGGLEMLRLPCHKIWLPDIVLYNNAAEYTDGMMPANAMITHQGSVFWPVPTKLQSSCKVDVTYFPFDEQYCRLKFGSWTYDGFQVDMFNRTTDVDLSNYVSNGEWELLSIAIERNVVYYGCCDEPFPDVTFVLHIRRRTIYYLYNVIFPCVMMSALTLLVFCLPPDSGEKITMGITVLLAFSVFLLRMGETLPETSEFIPLLSIYLTIVMALTSVSVILTVFVLNLHYRGPNDQPVPPWIKNIFSRNEVKRGLVFKRNTPYIDEYLSDSQSRYVKNVSLKLTIENLAQELKEELDNCVGSEYEAPVADSGYADTDSILAIQQKQLALQSRSTRTNEDILNALKKIIERYERDDNDEAIMYEWRQIATQVDRVLFWIFLVLTLSSTVILLIIVPVVKYL